MARHKAGHDATTSKHRIVVKTNATVVIGRYREHVAANGRRLSFA